MATQTDLDRRKFLRAACAEAGYPHAQINGPDHDPSITISGAGGVPDRIVWQAFDLLAVVEGKPHCCFQCWDLDAATRCESGRCPHGNR